MAKYTITKVDSPDDPDRCQAVNTHGQCLNKATKTGGYCPAHGGNKAINADKKERKRLYDLSRYRSRLEEMDSPNQNVKNLREEIGILRIVMEEIINRCDGPVDMLANAPKISDLATKIGKLVTQCHSIDKSLGQYLDKNEIVQIAQEMVGVIAGVVTDADDLTIIIEGIEATLDRAFE